MNGIAFERGYFQEAGIEPIVRWDAERWGSAEQLALGCLELFVR
jgi:hypothetical protein